jgi:hypothetical protein
MIHSAGMKATVVATIVSLVSTSLIVLPVQSFPQMPAVAVASQGRRSSCRSMMKPDQEHDSLSSKSEQLQGRRSFLWQATASAATGAALLAGFPRSATAGIDVSGLAGGSKGSDPNLIREQLKAFDGSGTGRVQQIKDAAAPRLSSTLTTMTPSQEAAKVPDTVATTATRSTLYGARTSSASLLTTRYQDSLAATATKNGVPVEFEYPSDWLQLDRALGGIQFVDQRNGDKLYVFRVGLPTMPNSSPTDANAPRLTVETVPNQWFGAAIFDSRGSFVKGGNGDVSEYKVVSSKVTAKQSEGVTPRRRLRIKYSTVTGNGYTVERRALVDAYQVGTEVFMLMTSSNAVKFEAKGRERDTVEAIADSFRIGE